MTKIDKFRAQLDAIKMGGQDTMKLDTQAELDAAKSIFDKSGRKMTQETYDYFRSSIAEGSQIVQSQSQGAAQGQAPDSQVNINIKNNNGQVIDASWVNNGTINDGNDNGGESSTQTGAINQNTKYGNNINLGNVTQPHTNGTQSPTNGTQPKGQPVQNADTPKRGNQSGTVGDKKPPVGHRSGPAPGQATNRSGSGDGVERASTGAPDKNQGREYKYDLGTVTGWNQQDDMTKIKAKVLEKLSTIRVSVQDQLIAIVTNATSPMQIKEAFAEHGIFIDFAM